MIEIMSNEALTSKVNCTDGSRTTRRGNTRIGLLNTLLILTDKARDTVWIDNTLGLTAGDGVGGGGEPGHTAALGVTVPVTIRLEI